MILRGSRLFGSTLVRLLCAVCAVAIIGARPMPLAADGPQYSLTDLGSLGCCNWWIWESEAIGLNNAGDIVGMTTSPADPSLVIPFIYRDGRMTAIRDWWGEAHAINDAGQAVGFVVRPGEVVARAFVYLDGLFTDLGTLPSRDHSAAAYAINSIGTIVGSSVVPLLGDHAFIYRHRVMLPLPGLAIIASGVNDASDVTGTLGRFKGREFRDDRGFLFSGLRMTDLGTLDGSPDSGTRPVGINNRRQIAGTADLATVASQHAFLWQDGAFQDLGTLRGGYSNAMGLNNRGDVVGFSDASVFVYRDGVMIDLNQAIPRGDSVWPIIQNVRAINDRGQIVGSAMMEGADGVVRMRACLLTPIDE